jgi:hypothetical protein
VNLDRHSRCSLFAKAFDHRSQRLVNRHSPDGRSIRPPWRKNRVAGSHEGARCAAAIYTLINTAKLNDVDPQAWLADVLQRIADHPAKRIAELLPWNCKPVARQAAAKPQKRRRPAAATPTAARDTSRLIEVPDTKASGISSKDLAVENSGIKAPPEARLWKLSGIRKEKCEFFAFNVACAGCRK